MQIYFKCPSCETRLDVDSDYADSNIICPHCQSSIHVPKRELGPGITIGGFRIKKLIGRGGMGEVYLARQLSMDRDVALKILPSHLTVQKDLLERFLHEVRMAACLEHPNIVTAYEAGQDEGVYYMAMMFVKGETLAQHLYTGGPMPEQQALDMAHRVACALEYAWDEHRLLHRDIKPANIMLDAHGEPRILDMGLSKRLVEGEGLTLSPTVMGTPNYMSPEQAAGEALDIRTDIYSLGATLYHALTNQIPFKAGTMVETLQKQATETLPDPRDFNPQLSEGCIELLTLMLAKHRELRHRDWKSLIGDIDRVRSGARPRKKPLEPGESTLLRYRPYTRGKRGRHAAGTGSRSSERWIFPLVGLIVLFSLVMLWQSRQTSPPPPATESAPASQARTAPTAPVQRTPFDQTRQRRRRLRETMQYARQHPDDFEETMKVLAQLRAEAIGTDLARDIQKAIDHLTKQQEQRQALQETLQQIRETVQQRVDAGDLDGAKQWLSAYDGPFAKRTANQRQRLIEHVDTVAEQSGHDRLVRAENELAMLQSQIAEALIKQHYTEVGQLMSEAERRPVYEPVQPQLDTLQRQVRQITAMPSLIMASFVDEIGQNISIELNGKKQAWIVQAADENAVDVRRAVGAGFVDRRITFSELSQREKFMRLGSAVSPERDIMRGLLLCEAGKPENGKRYFDRAGVPLSMEMAAALDQLRTNSREKHAEQAYMKLLLSAGLPTGETDIRELVKQVRRTGFTPAQVAQLQRDAEAFIRNFRRTGTLSRVRPLLNALAAADTVPREVEEEVVEQAIEELRRVNEDIADLVSIYYIHDSGLELNLAGNPDLWDLSPIAHLPVRKLNLAQTGVKDLAPLSGMPLQTLNIDGTRVEDLSPLNGLRLKEIHANGCRIKDLSPLRGMPLESLQVAGSKVTRIAPLSGMPLQTLDLCGCMVDDLRVLRDMPLETLRLCWTPVQDLRPLSGLPLKKLVVTACWALRDFAPLSEMTTLEELEWSPAHEEILLSRFTGELADNDWEGAAQEIDRVINIYREVPAFNALREKLIVFRDKGLPEWEQLFREIELTPKALRSYARSHNGHHYALCPLFMPRDEARAFCQKLNGDLAAISSPEEQHWITEQFTVPGLTLWLGGSDAHKEGQWQWLSGEPAKFANWAPGEPNDAGDKGEDAMILHSNGMWLDVSDSKPRPFLIEWKK